MTGHQCPVPPCTNQVPAHQLMCASHWYRVPKPLRDEVWHQYKLGAGSTAHLEACAQAIASLESPS